MMKDLIMDQNNMPVIGPDGQPQTKPQAAYGNAPQGMTPTPPGQPYPQQQ